LFLPLDIAVYGNMTFSGEGCETVRQRTFAELYADVACLAAAMKAVGVQQGDRVVGMFKSQLFYVFSFEC
jgi:acyl-coenzyme A synthetase/AMP-(fatty) acid ligase